MNIYGLPFVTVSEARTLLGSRLFGWDSSTPEFYSVLNEVGGYFYTQGQWIGTTARYVFTLPTDKILVLPYHLEGLRGIRVGTTPRSIVSGDAEFLGNGGGSMTLADTKLVVKETYSVTPVSWPSGKSGTITLTGTGTDEARLFGTDVNGQEIIDVDGAPGESVNVGSTSVKTFYSLTGMTKPITVAPITVTLNCTPSASLGKIPAGITSPMCERYQVRDSTATEVTVLCSRRWVNVAREEDVVLPWVARAWKLALLAKEKEDNGHLDVAKAYYSEAISILNDDVRKRESDDLFQNRAIGSAIAKPS